MQFIKPSLLILKRYYSDTGTNLKMLLSRELDKLHLHSQHQAITRIVYEVVRHHRLLDYIIRKFSQRKLKKIQPDIRLLLKISAYLLLFSQSYPDYAVVNETIKLIRPKAKGFANALLRNIAANKAALLKEIESIQQPEILYSISDDLLEQIKHHSLQPEPFLVYLNQEPRFHIRINSKTIDRANAIQLLEEQHISFTELEKFDSYAIKETGQVIDQLLSKQLFYFQDTGSQLISILTAQYAQKNVLDCCAAPGTKSVTLSLLNPNLSIYANDINHKRSILMKQFLNRYEIANVIPLVSDIKQPGLKSIFDFIIVDAPCTSAGTIRKNPDLKIKIDTQLINQNTYTQKNIMETIITRFPHSKYILYSVCSFIYEESDGMMNQLSVSHPQFNQYKRVEIDQFLEQYGFIYKKGEFGYYLLPNETLQNDLFYISLLEKK